MDVHEYYRRRLEEPGGQSPRQVSVEKTRESFQVRSKFGYCAVQGVIANISVKCRLRIISKLGKNTKF
jgi:hypothetical protein